jgi:hypothetical protein
VLQLIGNGDAQQSAFRIDETGELRLAAYNFGKSAVRGVLIAEGASGETGDIEIRPGGREERTISAIGPGNVTVRLDLKNLGRAVVSGRVTKMTPANETR